MKHNNVSQLVDSIIQKVGSEIRLAIPLGAGKPNHIVNELYRRAKDKKIKSLKIYTALTINKPSGGSFLEKRFLGPFLDRVFLDYPNFDYETDRKAGALPENIEVIEFYFPAGKQIGVKHAQENYISSNYTHVSRDLVDMKVNVVAQMIAPAKDEQSYSLSCNPDVTLDVLEDLRKNDEYPFVYVGQVNRDLPYMYGDAVVAPYEFDAILDSPDYEFKVVAPPKMSIPEQDYMIGLYASTLVKDGGELQVGIGSLGDALVNKLLLRHQDNPTYKNILKDFDVIRKFSPIINKKGDLEPFQEGLFAATEMFVDSMMFLFDADILKRKVYDHLILQRLINEEVITENIKPETLYHLIERRAVQPKLSKKDFHFLTHFGILKESLQFKDGYIITNSGERIEADLNSESNMQKVIAECLGSQLQNGAVAHGGFFLGPRKFYDWLNNLPEEKRRLIHMKSVRKINQLYGHEALDRLHRTNARFINTCLKMTLLGAAVSDGLENGQVISGVGGQYNFVSMAQALPDGHSILQLRSVREKGDNPVSNIVFNYGHVTIPRHLRDIVITEYGIADIRGKSDTDVIASLIEIADSRFQQQLISEAKKLGKLKQTFSLKPEFRENYPEKYKKIIQKHKQNGLFKPFPFGCDFTDEELVIGKALKVLKANLNNKPYLLKTAFAGMNSSKDFAKYLQRMQLDQPSNFQEKFYANLIKGSLL